MKTRKKVLKIDIAILIVSVSVPIKHVNCISIIMIIKIVRDRFGDPQYKLQLMLY